MLCIRRPTELWQNWFFNSSSKDKCFLSRKISNVKDTLLSVNVPSGCSTNIKAPDFEWTEPEALSFSLPCHTANVIVVTLRLYYPCSLLHRLWRKTMAWKNPEEQKKGSWCKLGINSSEEIQTSFQGEKKRFFKKHLPMSWQVPDNPQRTFRNHVFN